jgi:hypothetical protein
MHALLPVLKLVYTSTVTSVMLSRICMLDLFAAALPPGVVELRQPAVTLFVYVRLNLLSVHSGVLPS